MPPDVNCALCGLKCGRHPVTHGFQAQELLFCCIGCMNVYAILLESGVLASGQDIRQTEVFRRSLELGLISNPDQDKAAEAAIDPRAPTSEALLQISGMWCSSCAWLIERALRSLPGVRTVEMFFASDLAKIRYCPQYVPPDQLVSCINQLGYRASEYAGDTSRAKDEIRDLLLRLGVAAFLWLNIMGFSTILYVGYFEQISATASRWLPFLLWAFTTPLVFYCAAPILRAAVAGIRNLQVRMETLLALGIVAAYGYSAVQAVRGETHVYFDTAAAIVTLVLAGKLIERSAKQRAARSIALLYRLMPKKARVLANGVERFVSIDALQPGEIFVVKAGERVPADGIVVEGQTHADESLLTGESAPVARRPGDRVISGALNAGGIIQVRATKASDDSTLAQIIRLVEGALSTRAPIERTVDRVSRIFVPVVVVLAVATLVWGIAVHAGVPAALMRAITVLVIACPCALGLATPLAITAAVGAASQNGVLVSDSSVLETVRKLDVVVLDKTGTVTRGDFQLLDFAAIPIKHHIASAVAAGGSGGPVVSAESPEPFFQESLPVLAAVEAYSEHPLGLAVVRRAHEHAIAIPQAWEVEVHKGEGISGFTCGRRVFVGNRSLALRFATDIEVSAGGLAREWQNAGYTVTFYGWDSEVRGMLAFGDQVKPEAADLVHALKKRGLKVTLVSGDAHATTAAVAARIGADDYVAEATPAGKTRILEELQRGGKRVAMIGDGVNDAPALAQADLGVALGTGTDIAMRAAPVVLMSDSLLKVEQVFELAGKTARVVRQNLFWAFFYNAFGVTLAISGVLNPILAAGAMLLSSASVLSNSLRLSRGTS